jgi:hypothetical protein
MKKKKTDLEIRRAKLGKIYWTSDTEMAIVEFNNSNDLDERETIFRERIHPAIDKLAENIINRFKFPYIDGTFDDIKNQVVSFLVLNLHKYTQNKGKAFSYFSVVAKNYLVLNNNNSYRDELRSSPILETSSDETFLLDEILTTKPDIESSHKDTSEFISLLIDYWDTNLDVIFKKKRDKEIANAVVELMRRANTIENFNKKALYVLIREMTNNKTVHITKVINKMKVHVIRHVQEFRKTGIIQ